MGMPWGCRGNKGVPWGPQGNKEPTPGDTLGLMGATGTPWGQGCQRDTLGSVTGPWVHPWSLTGVMDHHGHHWVPWGHRGHHWVTWGL